MNKSHLFFGAFLLSLGAAVYLYKSHPEVEQRRELANQVAPDASKYISFQMPAPEFADVLPWERYEAGKAKNFSLSLKMEKRMSCNSGDFDAILGNLKRSDEKKLILSLESLSVEDNFKPMTLKLSESEFKNGFRHQFQIPKGPKQLGLFLCKDSDNIGRCSVKPVVDINQLLRENLDEAQHALPAQAPDRIYYFQYLFVDADGAVHVFRDAPIAPQAIAVLNEKLAKFFPKDQLENERMSLAKADLFNRTLVSVPLEKGQANFSLTLPARDNAHCPSVAEVDRQLRMHFPIPQ